MSITEHISATRNGVLLSIALVAFVAMMLVLGGVALATSDATQYAGCITPGGDLVDVAEGDVPAKECKGQKVEAHWPSQSAHEDLAAQVASLEGANDALVARIAALEGLLVGVANDGTTLTVTGNLQVVNGTGTTNGEPNGEGNLIIGYNTDLGDDKSGSHYVVVGDSHTYTEYSGIVVGFNNNATGRFASVAGGIINTASGNSSFVGGGFDNIASGINSFVGGGLGNIASGNDSFVGGGEFNAASGDRSFVGGGSVNTASGNRSFVGGGFENTASSAGCGIVGGAFGVC